MRKQGGKGEKEEDGESWWSVIVILISMLLVPEWKVKTIAKTGV